jgi:hypothetical protein
VRTRGASRRSRSVRLASVAGDARRLPVARVKTSLARCVVASVVNSCRRSPAAHLAARVSAQEGSAQSLVAVAVAELGARWSLALVSPAASVTDGDSWTASLSADGGGHRPSLPLPLARVASCGSWQPRVGYWGVKHAIQFHVVLLDLPRPLGSLRTRPRREPERASPPRGMRRPDRRRCESRDQFGTRLCDRARRHRPVHQH